MLFQLVSRCRTVKVSHTFGIEFYPFKVLFHGKQLFLGAGIFGFTDFTFDDLGKLEQGNVKTNAPLQEILYCNFSKAVAVIYTFNWMPQIELCWMKKYDQQKVLFYLLSSFNYDFISLYVETVVNFLDHCHSETFRTSCLLWSHISRYDSSLISLLVCA